MHSGNLSVRQHLDVEADAHLAVQPPVSLNSHEVFSVLGQLIALVPLASPRPGLRAVARWGTGLSRSALHCDVGGRSDQWGQGRGPTSDQQSTEEQRKQGHLESLPPQSDLFVQKTTFKKIRFVTSSLKYILKSIQYTVRYSMAMTANIIREILEIYTQAILKMLKKYPAIVVLF